ncbi:hypothetical protein ACROYT_G027074 [Oculina patagonica]
MAVTEVLQAFAQWQTILIASAILLLIVYVFGFVTFYRSMKTRYGDVPGPTPLPIFGNLLDMIRHKGQMHLQMDEYYRKYGKVFTVAIFGKTPSLSVADPDMLKDIFVKEFDCFSDRPDFGIKAPEPFNSMMTRAERENWKRIRNTLTPAFSALKMKQMVPLMNSCCDTLLRKLSEVADKDQSVDIYKFLQGLTMDVIISAAFGINANPQDNSDDPVVSAAHKAMNRSTPRRILLFALSMLPFGNKIMSMFPSILTSNSEQLFKIAKEIVATKRAGKTDLSRKDMLDLMLAASDDPSVPESKKLSDMEVIAQSFVFLIAGYDTSSNTLGLTCHHIATHPDVQDKLQQEIDSVWTDEEQVPTYETVNELPYLDMVISETLRLYPPGFLTSRSCTKACVIKDIKIPKDSPILIPIYSIHRDPSIYPDPEKFDPERFSPAAKQSRNPYTYLPFGHGPHNCIGVRFAQMEMKLVLARMLKRYRLEVGPDTKIPPDVKVKGLLGCSEINLRVVSRK